MRLSAALTVVTSVTHSLVVAWPPEVTTKAHWRYVVNDRGKRIAHHTQRMLGEVRFAILSPLRGVVPWLLVPPCVHRLPLRSFWHAWH